MKALPYVLFAFATFTATPLRADISCPDRLAVRQQAEAPSGWSASYSEIPPRLAGVALFDGPPANKVGLKHDQRKQSGRDLMLIWNLRESPRSHYVQCNYERTTATIATALPPGVRHCEIVFDTSTSYPGGAMPVKRMTCR
ncbi:MAG TPA: STY0301 family protein [Burkholderiales bacterium]|nr:STY0301 family protein [Burkholderiales bacterium]